MEGYRGHGPPWGPKVIFVSDIFGKMDPFEKNSGPNPVSFLVFEGVTLGPIKILAPYDPKFAEKNSNFRFFVFFLFC